MTNRAFQVCERCIMDTTDPDIRFDVNGICNHCTEALQRLEAKVSLSADKDKALKRLTETIISEGKGKEYDCIIGVSGGVDSSATAYHVKNLGLRPLAVHFDNGWNTELAVNNIKNMLDLLDIDLYTHVVDWEEFRDIQLSFLKASVANCEIPTDHAILALLWHTAYKYRVRFILTGSNLMSESIMPYSWGHYCEDLRHLKAIHKRFGKISFRTMPTISLGQYCYYVFVKGIRQIPFLNYLNYDKNSSKKILTDQLKWRDYGGKHYESIWTRFFQGYYLPTKFGFDKRKAHLSSLICSGQITRDKALEELQQPLYDSQLLRQDKEFVIKKFGLSPEEFEEIMVNTPRKAIEFPSYYFLFEKLKKYKNIFRKIATNI